MNAAQQAADYQSDFDFDTSSEASGPSPVAAAAPPTKKKRRRSSQLADGRSAAAPAGSGAAATDEAASRQEAAVRRQHLVSLDAYSRHKQLVNDYIRYYGGSYADLRRDDSNDKRDWDIVRQHHRFVWDEGDEDEPGASAVARTWEQRLAKRYWDKLFKEYCLADLRKYKEGKIGLRWRTEDEVVSGRGQFTCGSKRCQQAAALTSWEVNFAYVEAGQRRNALVKLRLCSDCSRRLNYRKRHKQRSATVPADQAATADAAAAAGAAAAADSELSEQLRTVGQESQQPAPADEQAAAGDEIWRRKPSVDDEEASREEEFDKYFADMLL